MAIRELIEILWKSKGARVVRADAKTIKGAIGELGVDPFAGFSKSLGAAGLALGIGATTIALAETGAEAKAVDNTFKALSGSASQAQANLMAMESADI